MNDREETSQVQKFRVVMLFTKYEAFKMKENEYLLEIITRLTTLINELSSLERSSPLRNR